MEYTVEMMCRVFTISRSSYYKWKKNSGRRQERLRNIRQDIKDAYDLAKGRYGSPRITEELRATGRSISRRTVAKHMKEMGLRSKVWRRYKITTDSSHKEPVAENILNRDFVCLSPATKCVSDITYIKTTEGFLYLTAVIDLFDRDVIGWNTSDGMSAQQTVLPAIKKANANRNFVKGMLFHSDRGVQYACKATVNTLNSYNITQSMSRKANCWDNAVAESFFKSLKTELIYGKKLMSKQQMKTAIFEYIEIWYRKKRRHSYLKYKTIPEFNKYKSNSNNNFFPDA